MKDRNSKIILAVIFLAIISSVFFATSSAQAVDFTYKPMEKIPGFENVNIADFPTLIETIYRFALWVVGICALFMITIGGFSYMTSAGNTAKAGSGKAIITDALIGLVLVFTAFLIFYVINPNITSVDLKIAPAGDGKTLPPTGAACNGSCFAETCFSLSRATEGVGTCPDKNKPNCCVFFTDKVSCAGGDCSLDACTADRPAIDKGTCGDANKKCCKLAVSGSGDTCSKYANDNSVINFSTTESSPLPGACADFDPEFRSAAAAENFDVRILKAIAAQESKCAPNSQSSSNPPSCGFMQLQPGTAGRDCEWLKKDENVEESIRIAARYIKANQGTHGGNLEKIAAGYNGGYGTVSNTPGEKPAFGPSSDCPGALAYQCCINPGGLKETQDYVFKVTKYYNGQ